MAFPTRSGARLMRFLARVMESRSPLLHSMGSSRMAAAGAKELAAVTLGRDPAQLHATPQAPAPLRDLHCYTSSHHAGTSAPAAAIVSASILPPTRGLSRRFAHLPGLARHVGDEIFAAAAALPAGALQHDTAAYAAGVLVVPSTHCGMGIRRSPRVLLERHSRLCSPKQPGSGHRHTCQQRKNVPR